MHDSATIIKYILVKLLHNLHRKSSPFSILKWTHNRSKVQKKKRRSHTDFIQLEVYWYTSLFCSFCKTTSGTSGVFTDICVHWKLLFIVVTVENVTSNRHPLMVNARKLVWSDTVFHRVKMVLKRQTSAFWSSWCVTFSVTWSAGAQWLWAALSNRAFSCSWEVASFCCIRSAWPLVTPQLSGVDIEGHMGRPDAGFSVSQ